MCDLEVQKIKSTSDRSLPGFEPVDVDKTTASFQNGLLEIEVPKAPAREEHARKVPVSTAA